MTDLIEKYFEHYDEIKSSLWSVHSYYWMEYDDVMQEMYIRLRRPSKRKEAFYALGLLKTIARYTLIDMVKRDFTSLRLREYNEREWETGEPEEETYTHVEEDYITKESHEYVKAAAEQLGPRRSELVGKVLENKSDDEIAKELNMNKETVRMNLYTATKDLAEMRRKYEIKINSKQQAKLEEKDDELLL